MGSVAGWSPQVGHQLRRRSDGARFDILVMDTPRRQPNGPLRLLLVNLATGRRHWIVYENWPRRYEPCPAFD